MAGDSYIDMARRLRLWSPTLPFPLAQQFIKNRYRQTVNDQTWSFSYAEGQMTVFASIFGNAAVIRTSNTVVLTPNGGITGISIVSAGVNFQAGDVIYLVGGCNAQVTVNTVGGGGQIATWTLSNVGCGYSTSSTQSPSQSYGGNGTGATFSITSVGNGVLPGDNTTIVGRQILFGGLAPIYTIVQNPDTQTVVIDQNVGIQTQSQISFEVSCIYFTSERTDFERLETFKDTVNSWQLWRDVAADELNAWDAQRSSAGTPTILANLTYNTEYLALLTPGIPDYIGLSSTSTPNVRQEIWPRQQADYVYPYLYKRAVPDLQNNTDTTLGAVTGDIIVEGALADLCMWPGTPEVPNPKRNPVEYNIHQKRYNDLVDRAKYRDHAIIERDVKNAYMNTSYAPWPFDGLSARYYQNHAPVGLVYGGF